MDSSTARLHLEALAICAATQRALDGGIDFLNDQGNRFWSVSRPENFYMITNGYWIGAPGRDLRATKRSPFDKIAEAAREGRL